MLVAPVPAAAVSALRAHVARFLHAYGVEECMCLAETDLYTPTLSAFLIAALEYVREEHPWIGRKGWVVDAPAEVSAGTAAALDEALPALDSPLTTEACVEALRRTIPFESVELPCGRASARPRAFLDVFFPLPDALHGSTLADCSVQIVVADERWISNPTRREDVLHEVVRPNYEGESFFELDSETAHTVARFLFAGSARRDAHEAYRAQAEAFLALFGRATRWFASRDLQSDELEDPFAHGSTWSSYDASGHGSWGTTLALVVSDGFRAAYLDEVWDVSSE